jgi:hypothetical protein
MEELMGKFSCFIILKIQAWEQKNHNKNQRESSQERSLFFRKSSRQLAEKSKPFWKERL